ncbi:MAG: tetratricopeptide repeat protein, partial [Parcubacteria group bacterium]|nr:tetratricopeptide repeat protein [Parcubacteria group bacterium]
KEHALFGSGPGTFVFDYSKFHSSALNQTTFWGTRFSAGAAQVLDIAVTLGALGILVFIGLLATTLVAGFRALFGSNPESGQDGSWLVGLGMTASFVGLVVSFMLYPANFTMWFLFWMLLGGLGMFASKEMKVSLAPPSLLSVASSFTFLLVLVFGLGLLFVGGQRYAAELYYAGSARLAQQGDVEGAIEKLQTALRLNPGMDLYWRDIAQLFLARIGRINQDGSLSSEQRQQQTQVAVNNAVSAVRNATTVAKANVANWNVQGSVSQNLLAVAGAKELAVQAYEQAAALEPASPFAWGELGRVYVLFANQQGIPATLKDESLQKAFENLDRAIQLKSDYAPAHFLKAAAYELQGKSAEAASQLEALKVASPKDVGLAFQLGMVYWQKEDVAKAQREFLSAKQLNPNYSNALYMLGLTYDKQGNKDAALREFRQVASLNPENEGVKSIIKNLEEGKPALEGIVSPEPPVQQTPPEINRKTK